MQPFSLVDSVRRVIETEGVHQTAATLQFGALADAQGDVASACSDLETASVSALYGPALATGTFMRAFCAKSPFEPLLEKMPVKIILNAEAGLLGAAVRARQVCSAT